MKTPLRYPGGKSKLTPFLSEILKENKIENGTYIEPFAGGAGIAINLLLSKQVHNICLNDKDRSIYAFWYTVLNDANWLIKKIIKTQITIEEWKKQRIVQENKINAGLSELGFSTLFLNRTNFSGIIKAGVIGGINQMGNYKIDARFNKSLIIQKISDIANKKDSISFHNLDALEFIYKIIPLYNTNNSIIYFDPPYFEKGYQLYMNYYDKDDHNKLAKAIGKLFHKWLISYDNVKEIKELYREYNTLHEISLPYSIGKNRKGREIIFTSKNILLPKL